MRPQIQDVRQALTSLGNLDREITGNLPAYSTEEVVALGQRLWWLVKRSTKALDPIKVRLRELAVQQAGSVPGCQRFEASDGAHCIVTIPNSSLILRKDADMHKVKSILGDADFFLCFDEIVTYKPKKDIQDIASKFPKDKAAAVMTVLDMADNTPKVAFKD